MVLRSSVRCKKYTEVLVEHTLTYVQILALTLASGYFKNSFYFSLYLFSGEYHTTGLFVVAETPTTFDILLQSSTLLTYYLIESHFHQDEC